MKTRSGFVSNSSSTSFVIRNNTKKALTLYDFALENVNLLHEFIELYSWHKNDERFTEENFLQNAKLYNEIFVPGENHVTYGDEDGDIIGTVFDYMLRKDGESESFNWWFVKYNR